jgi:hypothetical protein
MPGGRLEAFMTVPAASTVTATNAGAASTSVPLTTGSYTPTSYLAHLVSQLNTTRQGYPTTAAKMNEAVGYGTWTAGWLCNESSGSLAATFGAPSLSAVGTPTYSNDGYLSAPDKAISFDASGDGFSGGDVHDVTATDDLVLAWVAKVTATPAGNRGWFSKGAAPGWYMYRKADGALTFNVNDIVDTQVSAVPLGEWHVGIAVVDRAANVSRVGVRGLTSGTTTVSATSDITAQGTLANGSSFLVGEGIVTADTDVKMAAFWIGTGVGAGTGLSANLSTALSNFADALLPWTGSLSTGSSGTGLVTLDCGGTWALTFTTAAAGTALGIVGDIAARTTAATGTQNARGLWLPGCPAIVELDPLSAPKVTDSRATESPLGLVITYKGTSKRVHKLLSYSHALRSRLFESSATTTYASLQQWIDDTQYGDGHTWFTPGSAFQVYWDDGGTDTLLGYELNSNAGPTYGWAFSPAISDLSEHARRVDAGWLGQWAVNFPRLVSRG